MAHALWHIEPSFYKDYWKKKLMGGAEAVQEGLMNPMFDRLAGTAPGIPARPWFGGETSGGRPAQVQTPTQRPSLSDIDAVWEGLRNMTPASLGLTMPPSAPVTGPPPTPSAMHPANLSPREQAIAAQVRASSMANGRSTGMNLATPPADPAFVRMMQGQPNPFEPSGPLTSVLKGRPTSDRILSGSPKGTAPASSTAGGYLSRERHPRVAYSGPSAMGPGGLPPSVRETGAHTQLSPPTREKATPGLGRPPRPVGPFKEQIKEASKPEATAPVTEQDKLRRMLKMMFLSDLIRGTDAPNPDYYSAVSVGPASRAFAPLPSMFRGR
tara:strand:- start:27 stop:1004 length:978 start_codon:yes stop_codon:yes gene_type:complete